MSYANKDIYRNWKIICVLEYLLGAKLVPVKTYELKAFARRISRIKELFKEVLTRKENKDFKLSWFYHDREINEGELRALSLVYYESWKVQQKEME